MQDHHYFPEGNISLVAAASLKAGTDYNCGCVLPSGIPVALSQGILNIEDVNKSVRRILRTLFLLGEFDANVPYRSWGLDRFDTDSHRSLALDAAMQGLVLLKNDGRILPFDPSTKVALIGPNADNAAAMLSSYVGQNVLAESHTPWKAAQAMGLPWTYEKGCDFDSDDTSGIPRAVMLAKASERAVLVLGLHFQSESEWGNPPDCVNDRVNITLPDIQLKLLSAVLDTGIPTTVVLMNGGTIGVQQWIGQVSALIEAFYPGELGGDAIVRSLLGQGNRWGRLSHTFYPDRIVERSFYTVESAGLTFDGGITNMQYTGKYGPVVFPFGFGLSYTTFSYSWANTSTGHERLRYITGPDFVDIDASIDLGDSHHDDQGISFRCNVTNTGSITGDAIVFAFVSGPSPDYPLQRLFGFERITLESGESRVVQFLLSYHSMAGVTESGERWLKAGTVLVIRIGDVSSPVEHTVRLISKSRRSAVQLPLFPGSPSKTLRKK